VLIKIDNIGDVNINSLSRVFKFHHEQCLLDGQFFYNQKDDNLFRELIKNGYFKEQFDYTDASDWLTYKYVLETTLKGLWLYFLLKKNLL